MPEPRPRANNISNLTQRQLAIWTGHQLSAGLPIYNMAFTFELEGKIDIAHFQNAFQHLINKCDVMRTVFFVENDIPLCKTLKNFSYPTRILDWSNNPDVDKKLVKLVTDKIGTEFDLSTCLFESILIKYSQQKYVWYINQHHLITDGWSISVQFRILADLYTLLNNGESVQSYSIPQFQNYIAFEKSNRTKFIGSSVETYWSKKLESLPKPPKLYNRVNKKDFTATTRTTIEIGKVRADKLRELLKDRKLQMLTTQLSTFNIFLTILYAYIYRISGEEKIAIGTPSHNRINKEFKNTIGIFVEFFPILSEVDSEDSLLDLYNRLKNESYTFLKNAYSGINNSNSGRRFSNILNYYTATFGDFDGIKCNAKWHHSGHFEPQNDLGLEVLDFDQTGNFKLNFDIKDSIIPKSKQALAIGHFFKIFDAFLDDYNHQIAEIELVSEHEKNQILEFGNANQNLEQESRTILTLFYEQVEKSPSKTVVQFGNDSLTFEELDNKSNQLANCLISQGLQHESKVGLLLERSCNLLVGIFGILKAGGAYVPLDKRVSQRKA